MAIPRALLLLLTGLASACTAGSASEVLRSAGFGPAQAPAEITDIVDFGDYLGFELRSEAGSGSRFVHATESCRRALSSPDVQFDRRGGYGSLSLDDLVCPIEGFRMLSELRDSRPSAPVRGRPRAQATFTVLVQRHQVALARGSFPLAGLLGLPLTQDLIAVISLSEECQGPLARGVAPLEYHQSGPYPLTLVSEKGDCPVDGLVRPRPENP